MVAQRGLYEETSHNSVEIEGITKAVPPRQCLIEWRVSPDFNCYKSFSSSQHPTSNLSFRCILDYWRILGGLSKSIRRNFFSSNLQHWAIETRKINWCDIWRCRIYEWHRIHNDQWPSYGWSPCTDIYYVDWEYNYQLIILSQLNMSSFFSWLNPF